MPLLRNQLVQLLSPRFGYNFDDRYVEIGIGVSGFCVTVKIGSDSVTKTERLENALLVSDVEVRVETTLSAPTKRVITILHRDQAIHMKMTVHDNVVHYDVVCETLSWRR